MRHFLLNSCVGLVGLFAVSGCHLYEDIPVFEERDIIEPGLVDGDLCGPCELGVWANDACDLGLLEGTIDAAATCDKIIFVDGQAGRDDAEAGNQGEPFKTLSAAISAGNARNATVVIIAGGDVHEGPVLLGDGLSIVGGFTRAWAQDAGITPVIRAEFSDTTNDGWAVFANGLKRPTIVRNIMIQSLGDARTHYAMRVFQSQKLVLERVQ